MMEEWRDIPGYEGMYKISNLGNVKAFKVRANYYPEGVEMTGYMCAFYKAFSLTKNGVRKAGFIHKLLAQAFLPNPNNYKVVNHKDGNKLNNDLSNLEWCTKSHDRKESYRLGLSVFKGRKGDSNPCRKLSSVAVEVIKAAIKEGFTQRQIATYFKISQSNVSFITNNKRWNV